MKPFIQVEDVEYPCRETTSDNLTVGYCRHVLIGYARVSTGDQNPNHQIDALRRAGVSDENIHVDHASGAKASRPQLDLVLRLLRQGDQLAITRLDRLGRSVLHLIGLGAELREKGRRPEGARTGHRHRHRRGPRHVRDALGARRAPTRVDRGQHPQWACRSQGSRPQGRAPTETHCRAGRARSTSLRRQHAHRRPDRRTARRAPHHSLWAPEQVRRCIGRFRDNDLYRPWPGHTRAPRPGAEDTGCLPELRARAQNPIRGRSPTRRRGRHLATPRPRRPWRNRRSKPLPQLPT